MTRSTRKFLIVVMAAALAATTAACGSSDDATARNATVVAGTACKKPGQYTKVSGQKVVCGRTVTGGIWYGVAAVKKKKCAQAGRIAEVRSVALVCGTVKKARVWVSTKPLPPAVTFAGDAISTTPGVADNAQTVPVDFTDPATPDVAVPQATTGAGVTSSVAGGSTTTVAAAVATTTSTLPPQVTRLAADIAFKKIATDANSQCGIDAEGAVWCWGYNADGQLGTGDTAQSSLPVRSRHFDGVNHKASAITAVSVSYCAIETNGAVLCWGDGMNGAIGDGRYRDSAVPVPVNGFDGTVNKATYIDGYDSAVCVVDVQRRLWCWGKASEFGRFGVQPPGSSATQQAYGYTANSPVQVPGLDGVDISTAAIGARNTCISTAGGAVWCWGRSGNALGYATAQPGVYPPAKLEQFGTGLKQAKQLAGMGNTFCVRNTDNTVMCWGHNFRGELGADMNTNEYSQVPIPVRILTGAITVRQIIGHGQGFCAVAGAGALYCWGGDYTDITNTTRSMFVPTVWQGFDGSAKRATTASRGMYQLSVLNDAGTIFVRGINRVGAFGDGTISDGN